MGRLIDMGHYWSRQWFLISILILTLVVAILSRFSAHAFWGFAFIVPYTIIGLRDMLQKRQALRRNYPVLANLRYFLESIRPEIRQYFMEAEVDEYPFSRQMRSVIYQRAKGELDTLPFGTRLNVNEIGYEWVAHSIKPLKIKSDAARILVGSKQCLKPYDCSIFNVSAMSFGSLSKNAVMALNRGAKMGGFYHNTGEGGLSEYHLKNGGDLCWQIGTGYFGCRHPDGSFDENQFVEKANYDSVKLVEIKISQGAKPSHGGILPAAKLTKEIAMIRGVPLGKDVISPSAHSAFDSPVGLLNFVQRLRDLSGGKPVGFKLCIGSAQDFFDIVQAIVTTGITPDFITIDGAEGGTGAAPLEFSNYVGMPLNDALNFVHQTLIGLKLRDQIKLFTAGKIVTGFHLLQKMALGADACEAARAMMFALGCIQALKCNTNECPTGVATQNLNLVEGLDVIDKGRRVANYQRKTVESVMELLSSAGLNHPRDLTPRHLYRRVGPGIIKTYDEIYPRVQVGELCDSVAASRWAQLWHLSS